MVSRFRFRKYAGDGVRWILLGGNNRLIGVAASSAPTMDDAIKEAERTREELPGAAIGYTVGDNRHWYWRMNCKGVPIAVSSSGFARRLDAERAARRFCRAAADATIQPGLVTVPDRVRERPRPSRDPRFAGE